MMTNSRKPLFRTYNGHGRRLVLLGLVILLLSAYGLLDLTNDKWSTPVYFRVPLFALTGFLSVYFARSQGLMLAVDYERKWGVPPDDRVRRWRRLTVILTFASLVSMSFLCHDPFGLSERTIGLNIAAVVPGFIGLVTILISLLLIYIHSIKPRHGNKPTVSETPRSETADRAPSDASSSN